MKKNEARKKSSALVKSNVDGVEKSYAAWIVDLKRRYRATQIKAAVAVNSALIEFYWNLGKDISEKYARWTIQNGWSRNSLLNWLSTDLYEREGEWSSAA